MVRTPMRRLSAAFIALWFTISMVDTGWLHACEMHSVRPASEHQLGACCAAQSAVAVFSCDLHELTRVVTPPVAAPMVTRWTVASIDHRPPFATAPPTA